MLSAFTKNHQHFMRKQVLQKHQVAAFIKTMQAIEADLLRRINFIEEYNELYKFPAAIARENLREYRRQLKAINNLKSFSK
jgi:hypothetical protein